MQYATLLRSNLLRLFAAFEARTGLRPSAAARIVANDGSFLKFLPTRDIRVGTYDALAARFSALWPNDLAWPEDIDRPEPADVDEATQALVMQCRPRSPRRPPTSAIHPAWPHGEAWPEDIPLPPGAEHPA